MTVTDTSSDRSGTRPRETTGDVWPPPGRSGFYEDWAEASVAHDEGADVIVRFRCALHRVDEASDAENVGECSAREAAIRSRCRRRGDR